MKSELKKTIKKIKRFNEGVVDVKKVVEKEDIVNNKALKRAYQALELIELDVVDIKKIIRSEIARREVLYGNIYINDVPELSKLATIVCKHGMVTLEMLKGVRRHRYVVNCRKVFAYIANTMGYNLVAIGKFIGRDHTTIIHQKTTCLQLLQSEDLDITNLYNKVMKELKESELVIA